MGRATPSRRTVLRGAGGLMATALAGCLTGGGGEHTRTSSPTRVTVDVEPVRLGPEDSGRTLTVEQGRTVLIELPENPSTGYTWDYTVEGTVVDILEDRFYRTVTPEPGTPGTRRVLLRVVGSGRFVMEYERSWETTTPEKRFEVEFQIRDRQ